MGYQNYAHICLDVNLPIGTKDGSIYNFIRVEQKINKIQLIEEIRREIERLQK